MNKTQLKVLWVGIGIFVLMGLFPPTTRGYNFVLNRGDISLSRLLIQWAIIAAIMAGFIYSLKVDPELILKIPCFLSYLSDLGRRPYVELLEEARNKEDKSDIRRFWLVLLALLLLALIIIGLSYEGTVGAPVSIL
ncbi:unnamed protein product [marine sediment metagenome]|uniref:Uncharacterized protein n=1 Tax=marine sediment metagenome TaxID=412755 RepID=X0X4F0_9ZZZZ